MVPTLKKLQWDQCEEKGAALQFIVAKSDDIEPLKARMQTPPRAIA